MKLFALLCLIAMSGFSADFSRSEAGIVTDASTGLMWQDNDTIRYRQPIALKYCDLVEIGEFDDWTLPTIEQLRTIVDKSRLMPTIDPIFKVVKKDFYWTSTTGKEDEQKAHAIHFGMGTEVVDYKYDDYLIRCVRKADTAPTAK